MGIESYLGVPLVGPEGNHLGHLCVFDTNTLFDVSRKLLTFKIFAERAAAELDRLRLEKILAESEQRYRDLYEEAPIAYVHEDLQSRFISANRAACASWALSPKRCLATSGSPWCPTRQKLSSASRRSLRR
jgi:GAF domain-containing protein